MEAFRTQIASGLAAHGCPLSPEQITALQQVLVSAAEQDEGLPMAMTMMENFNTELQAEREGAERTERELKTQLRGWLSPTLYVSDGSSVQMEVAHPARAAALAAQGLPNQLHGDDLALAPGPPDETQRFRYSFVLPAQACVCTDIDLRQCERYKFDSGVLQVDPGDGHVQKFPAHITHVWDMGANEGFNTPLTIEDQGTVQLAEDVGEVGIQWLPGRDLADSWARMQQEGFIA
eukprot:COSAG02_NODE_15628_length_1153_cov_2.366224_2_plen_234_part_00